MIFLFCRGDLWSPETVEKYQNNRRTLFAPHINSVFTPIVGDGALDVPLLSNFFNKLGRPLVACVSHFLLCDFDLVI